MENLKLISVRIDPRIIVRIDKFVAENSYWKRNSVINSLLLAFLETSNRELFNIVEDQSYDIHKYRIKIEKIAG